MRTLDASLKVIKAPTLQHSDELHRRRLLKRITEAPALHGPWMAQAAAEIVLADLAWSTNSTVIHTAAAALRHPTLCTKPIDCMLAPDIDRYFEDREPDSPNYVRGSLNRPKDSDAPWIPHAERPITRPGQTVSWLNMFFKYAGAAVRCDPQGQRMQGRIHEVDWISHPHAQRLLHACDRILTDLALLAALSVGIHWKDIGGLRCSHVRRINGKAYLIGPEEPALLGPYAYPLELLKEERRNFSKDPDPFLFLAPGKTNEPMSALQVDSRVTTLANAAGFPSGMTAEKVMKTGRAALLDYGLTSDYIHFLDPSTPLSTLDHAWDVVEDVAGTPQNLGIGAPKNNGLPPFTVACRCGSVRFEMPNSCDQCQSRLPQEKLDQAHFLEIKLHQQIADLLRLRRETNDDRDRLFLGGDNQ